jgi:outer membrane lipoprotein-sorting protein
VHLVSRVFGWVILMALIAFPQAGYGKSKAGTANAETEVQTILKPFRQGPGVSVSIKKTSKNSLMMTDKTSEGTLRYWKGKLRVDTAAPDEAILVLDGRFLWLANRMPADMGGHWMVSKTTSKNFKKSNSFLAALLENQKLFSEFKLQKRVEKLGTVKLAFVPKKPASSEIQFVEINYLAKEKRLAQIIYRDDRENEVLFAFGVPKALEENRNDLFSYKPPPGAEVTEF